MDIDLGGSKITYDSTKAEAAEQRLRDFFKSMSAPPYPDGFHAEGQAGAAITKVEGREDFLKKLTAANQQMKPLLDKILSDKAALKQMASPTFAALPDAEKPRATTGSRQARSTWADRQIRQQVHLRYDGRTRRARTRPRRSGTMIKVTTELEVNCRRTKRPNRRSAVLIKSADLTSKRRHGHGRRRPRQGCVGTIR